MPEKLALSFLLKVVIAIVGTLFAFTMGGHFNENGDLEIKNIRFWITLIFSVMLSIFGSGFVIEHFHLTHRSDEYKYFICLMVAVFGVAFVGTLYRSYQLWTADKTLPEIITEIKSTVKNLLK